MAPLKPKAAADRPAIASRLCGAAEPKKRVAKRKVDSSASEEEDFSGSSDKEGESLPAEVCHSTVHPHQLLSSIALLNNVPQYCN